MKDLSKLDHMLMSSVASALDNLADFGSEDANHAFLKTVLTLAMEDGNKITNSS
jgi:hypothetical protein